MPPFALVAVGVVLKALTCWLRLPDSEGTEERQQSGDNKGTETTEQTRREKEGGENAVSVATRW